MRNARTVIFDIDGTLADLTHRRHHVASKPKNWDKFFEQLHKDTPFPDVVRLCQFMVLNNLRVVFCTGRGEEHRVATTEWLRKHVWVQAIETAHGPLEMYMRPAGDYRSDVVIKREMLERLRADGHDIWFVVDDRQRVVDMWRKHGVTVLQSAPGDFDSAGSWVYTPKQNETLLSIMVGPSGAGKSTFVDMMISGGEITNEARISSDLIRQEITGDWKDQTQNERVFSYAHSLIKVRMQHGLRTVFDATHLRRKDRLESVALAPAGTRVEYIVIDRPLEQKLKTGDWRLDVVRDGKTLVERHHESFQSSLKDILRGDNLSNVIVSDYRS